MLECGMLSYFVGLIFLMMNNSKILFMLLSMEFMMLGMFMVFLNLMKMNMLEMIFFYMVISVCEASLGLGLMVMLYLKKGMLMKKSNLMLLW